MSPAGLAQRADRDLVAALRGELAAIEPARACCRLAELAGLDSGSRRTPARPVARLAVRLVASGGPGAATSLGRGGLDWQTAAEHCRLAWLRGRFLSHGSLSLAGGRTHLEFVLPPDEAKLLASGLASIGLPGALRTRRGAGVVTWKSAETVLTFLRLVGASGSALELESRLVSRSLRGTLNRAINAEGANLRRQVSAATRQLEAIGRLDAEGRLERLAEVERAVARGRREAPEATFGELAQRLGLTRSLVQRVLGRLEALGAADSPR
jgi:DNA-binding protein WhiA